ncbi:hypothetical protein Btru_052009 [Bulinus truncatus]|nr:hypothetical protein Btru_052009 [Bulinus truncatus]
MVSGDLLEVYNKLINEWFQVIWRKVSEETPLTVGRETFHNTERIYIDHQNNDLNWNLVISKVQLNDSGVYECQVSSQYRHLRYHILLTVVGTPATTAPPAVENSIQIYGAKFVEKDTVILLTCNATGHEYVPEQLDWFFNGNKIISDDPPGRISIKTNNSIQMKSISSVLRIKGVQMEDSGLYLCRTTSLQIESFRVVVISADTHNVKRGTFAGKSDKWNDDDADEEAYQQHNSAHAPVLHRHLLTSILLLSLVLHRYFCTH